MRRADRLFRIVQLLRSRRLATAEWLAEQLGVSKRTIYRDIRDLEDSGVPVRGEAGVGYTLERGFELPPLTFNTAEIEALVLGMRMVERAGDPEMTAAARSAIDKIEDALPRTLRGSLARTPFFAPAWPAEVSSWLRPLRLAVIERRKVQMHYVRRDGERFERVVRPVGLYCWPRGWGLGAWCELRADWRNFRLDRIAALELLDAQFEVEEADRAGYLDSLRRQAAAEGWRVPHGLG